MVAAYVPRRESIVVGCLGAVCFERGWYAYVGSARRGRGARVARHQRADKPLHWHADYLFSRHAATLAWTLDIVPSPCVLRDGTAQPTHSVGGAKRARPAMPAHGAQPEQPAECLLANVLLEMPAHGAQPEQPAECLLANVLLDRDPRARRGPSRFGASDCVCAGHLLWFPDRAAITCAVAGTGQATAIQSTRGRRETVVASADTFVGILAGGRREE